MSQYASGDATTHAMNTSITNSFDRSAQVMVRGNDPKEGLYHNNSVQYPLATELMENYKEHFTHIVRGSWVGEYILSAGEKKSSAVGQFVDKEAPEMLTFKMVKGDWSGLQSPHSVMLSASTAKILFGNADPLSKVVMLNNETPLTVSGVYEDLPQNSHFKDIKFFLTWDLFLSRNGWIKERATNDWNNNFLKIYVEISPDKNFQTVVSGIKNAQMQKIKNIR